jgi:hypothetical protein
MYIRLVSCRWSSAFAFACARLAGYRHNASQQNQTSSKHITLL